MKKPLPIIGLMVALVAAISVFYWIDSRPLVVDASEVSLNSKGERVYKNEPLTGEVISYHAPGQLATAEQFVNGRRQGYSKKWFENGILGFEANYANGRRDGITRSWWINGNPRTEIYYSNGKKEGEAWSWYISGTKYKRANFVAGKPTGLQQGWSRNGDLISNFEYRNGRVYGLDKANTCVGLEDENLSLDYYKEQSS